MEEAGEKLIEKQTSVTNETKKKAKISHLLCVGETNSHNKICLAREGERERERVARASEFVCVSVRAQEISSSSCSNSK